MFDFQLRSAYFLLMFFSFASLLCVFLAYFFASIPLSLSGLFQYLKLNFSKLINKKVNLSLDMDISMENTENMEIVENMETYDHQDKLTIKVKLPGEDYHDLVIDWSDKSGPLKGQQVIEQLSLITAIPLDFIRIAWFVYTPYDSVYMFNAVQDESLPNNTLIKEDCAEKMNDGDCFAIETRMDFLEDKFEFAIFLYKHGLFSDRNCTFEYCNYSNTRAFLNRQIAIAKNSELLMQLRARLLDHPDVARGANFEDYIINHDQRMKIFTDFDIRHFTFNLSLNLCRSRNVGEIAPEFLPHYSRFRG